MEGFRQRAVMEGFRQRAVAELALDIEDYHWMIGERYNCSTWWLHPPYPPLANPPPPPCNLPPPPGRPSLPCFSS